MLLVVDRFHSTREFTIGKLSIHELDEAGTPVRNKFQCFTLEDPKQDHKIMGHTRIPAGTYEIKLRPEGGKYQKYLARFGEWQKPGMLHITNVPGFEWILIHPGNTSKDTEGCLLVGHSPDTATGAVYGSTTAYTDLYKMICKILQSGERVFITYEDNDI